MSKELLLTRVASAAAGQVKDKMRWWRQFRRWMACFVCSGDGQRQAPSENSLIDDSVVLICRKLYKYDCTSN